MIIKRITVKRLRAIKEKTLDFFPGLNVIKGSDNEAGKSSLRIAITKALFQDPTTSREDIQALTSWGTDEPWEVALEFDANGDSYRLTKSFKDKTAELTATGSREFVARNKNAIAEKIAELTGCPSELFFESTACIGQDELIRIIPESARDTKGGENAFGAISQRLQAKLSGTAGIDVPAILSKLYAKAHHKDAAGAYFHVQKTTEQIASLRSQKLEQKQKVNDILEKRQNLTRIREELEKIYQDLPAKQEVLNKNKKMLELQKEIAGDKGRYENFQRAKELKLKIENLERELRPVSSFMGAEAKIEQLDAVKNRVDILLKQQNDLQDELKALRRQKPALWMLLSGIALVVGGLIGLIASPYLWSAVIIGFLFAGYWVVTLRFRKKQINLANQRISELEGRLRDSEGEAGRLLKDFGCQDYEEYHERLAEYRTKADSKRDAANQLDALVAGKDWQKFVEENADLDIQMSARLKELKQLEPFKLEPFSLQKLEDEVNGLQKRGAELEQEKGSLGKFFEYMDADKDRLTEIEEELQELEQERGFWERKRKVYDITREILEEAHKQTLSRAADLLEEEIGRYIATVTDGRYGQVKVGGGDLSIRTFSPEKNDWVDVLDLSRATQDQFYICARLALVRLITGDRRPPILLDDPFVNFHTKRLRKTITLLQEIAKENQILLFTCSDSYDYLGTVVSIN